MRMRTECNLHLMLAARFTNRPWLVGLNPTSWVKYVDHFLGRKCYEMQVPGENGVLQPLNPPWAVVLNYEYMCRREAYKKVREDAMSLLDAMELVVKDSELKEIAFTSPIALGARKRGGQEQGGGDHKLQKQDNPKGKGKKAQKAAAKAAAAQAAGKNPEGKGKGKGKLVSASPDGRQICFGYNSVAGCSAAACARLHVCRVKGCLGEHPTHMHENA